MKMTPPEPQSRPARTLVLIFMMVFLGDDDEWTDPEPQRGPREATAAPAGLQMKTSLPVPVLPPPPQSRPARTLVLIFMVDSSVMDGWVRNRSATPREATSRRLGFR
jgi:hypothetical protein